jgi:hypothetical protein
MSDEPRQQMPALARLILAIAIGFCVGPLAVWLLVPSRMILGLALAFWAVVVAIILVRMWRSTGQESADPQAGERDAN